MLIAIAAISVGARHRKTSKDKVKALAESIETIGMKIPIAVRPAKERGRFVLVAGRHRIEAHLVLGRDQIEAVEFTDELDAALWEVAENLHRADLTAMQRNVALGEWVKLKEKKIKQEAKAVSRQVGAKRGRPESGVRAASRELSVPETSARRAVNIANHLTKKAQQEAERLGLDNNQRVLERAAGMPGEEEQVRFLQRTAKRKRERQEAKAQTQQPVRREANPATGKEAFERWYWSLDAELQSKVRIWLLQFDPSAFVSQLERVHEDIRAQASTLH